MNLTPGMVRVTTDGAIGGLGKAIRIFSIQLVSGATSSVFQLMAGVGTDGTAILQVDGLANNSVPVSYAGGIYFGNGCFAKFDSASAYATIGYTEEF